MGTNFNFRNFTNDFPSSGSDAGRQQQPLTPLNFPLARQSSIYSLTFDEFQSTVGVPGKDFGSMNMDELLKNIWSAEENQNLNMAAAAAAAAGALPVNDGLQRQGSLTLPRTLSQKTVDEVWKDIWKDYGSGSGGNERSEVIPQRQQTLGEMTLEEFLARAGVVREENNNNNTQVAVGAKVQQSNGGAGGFFGDLSRQGNNNNNKNGFGMVGLISSNGNTNPISMQPASNLHLNVNVNGGVRSNQVQPQVHQQQKQQQQPQIFPKQANNLGGYGLPLQGIGGANGLMQGGIVSPASQISSDGIGKSNGDTSSVSPVPYVFNGSTRGRRPNTAVEKVVERRQRRMIKNRESAARSRARKQAYTMELEAEVAKLKEENEELRRKQEEIMEVRKNQVMEMMSMEHGGKRRCLRRTQTGPW